MPDLRTCIALYEADVATRPANRPINVIRVAMLRTTAWRQDSRHLQTKFRALRVDSAEQRRCDQLALTGEHLGTERVGLVVEGSRG